MNFKDNNEDNAYFDEENRAYIKQNLGTWKRQTTLWFSWLPNPLVFIGREPNSAAVFHAQPRSTASSEEVVDVLDKPKEERNKIDNPVTHINKDDKRGVIGKPNKDWQ